MNRYDARLLAVRSWNGLRDAHEEREWAEHGTVLGQGEPLPDVARVAELVSSAYAQALNDLRGKVAAMVEVSTHPDDLVRVLDEVDSMKAAGR